MEYGINEEGCRWHNADEEKEAPVRCPRQDSSAHKGCAPHDLLPEERVVTPVAGICSVEQWNAMIPAAQECDVYETQVSSIVLYLFPLWYQVVSVIMRLYVCGEVCRVIIQEVELYAETLDCTA